MRISEIFDQYKSILERVAMPELVLTIETYYNKIEIESSNFSILASNIWSADTILEVVVELKSNEEKLKFLPELMIETKLAVNKLLDYLDPY